MTTPSSTTISSSDLRSSVELVELKPGLKFSKATLVQLLPDAETALFFGKVYDLDYRQVSKLLSTVLTSDVADALFSGDHSRDLQHYLVGGIEHDESCLSYTDLECDCTPVYHEGIVPQHERGQITFDPDVPKGEILPEVWKSLEVEVAKSIKAVAAKIQATVDRLPGKQGSMMFESMMVMNRKRPTIGDYKTRIHHERQKENLLILDVSGSMTSGTVRAIIDDVVALSYMANAHLAIVSDTATYWEPGTYDSEGVLRHAEFWGTHYEKLEPVLNQKDWGTVICVADYDSSAGAKSHLARKVKTHIEEVIDISLVDRPTFLAECVGQFASKVTPILVGNSPYVLS